MSRSFQVYKQKSDIFRILNLGPLNRYTHLIASIFFFSVAVSTTMYLSFEKEKYYMITGKIIMHTRFMVNPVLSALDAIENSITQFSRYALIMEENNKLRYENSLLNRDKIRLMHDNWQLKQIGKILDFSNRYNVAIHVQKVKFVSDAGQKFCIIDLAGIQASLYQPVVSDDGLIGRVIYIDEKQNIGRVMLLTDEMSFVPAISNKTNSYGMITGNGSKTLSMIRLRGKIEVGEFIVTGNMSNVIHSGIPIGFVTEVHDNFAKVRMLADLSSGLTFAGIVLNH